MNKWINNEQWINELVTICNKQGWRVMQNVSTLVEQQMKYMLSLLKFTFNFCLIA